MENYTYVCAQCQGHVAHPNDLNFLDGKFYCDSCYDVLLTKRATNCHKCGRWVDQPAWVNNKYYCNSCCAEIQDTTQTEI
jgi:hypothetical protein